MSGEPWACGVDIGGTRLSVGLVSESGGLAAPAREATPREQGAQAAMARLLSLISRVLANAEGKQITGIGIGFGGPVDFAAQRIRLSHHVHGWGDVDLRERVSAEFGLPVVLENDANAAGLAEARFGAGANCGSLLYINVGTGVGGAIVLGGHVHHGAHGNAGEFGHMVLDSDGPPCACGGRGCVEALCSGDAIGRAAREMGRDLSGREVGESAARGEPWAEEIIGEAGTWMGLGIANVVHLLDPQLVVLGGGVPEIGDAYLGPVRTAFRARTMPALVEPPEIVAAKLGYDAGVIGAGAVALFRH